VRRNHLYVRSFRDLSWGSVEGAVHDVTNCEWNILKPSHFVNKNL
jgi:hypothetical protein